MAGEARLADLCESIVDCPHSTPVWTDSGVVVLRNQNIRNGRLDLSEPSYTDEAHFVDRTRRALPSKGDLVITREAPMGEVCMIPPNLRCCLGQRMVLLRPNRKRAEPRYLLYALQSKAVQHEIGVNEGTGSTVSNLRIPLLEALPIPVRSLPEQRAIAQILGTLDDKIELNRRMNETLEAMARALFKSWFVDFDPVRAKAEGRDPGLPQPLADLFPDSFEDSALGEIPRGWATGVFDDLAVVSSGKRPNVRYSEASAEVNVPLWGGNGPMAFVPSALIEHPILLTGRVGTLGIVFRITTPCWPSDNTLIVRAKDEAAFEYLFFQLRQIDFRSLNRGSTQPLLTQTDLKQQPLVLPPLALLVNFHGATRRLYRRVDETHAESSTLAALRDTLLPRLISGELRVRSAERIVSASI